MGVENGVPVRAELTPTSRALWWVAGVLVLGGCAGTPAPGPGPASTTAVVLPTSAVPVVVPAQLALGDVEIDRPATGSVEVRPARRAVTFGRTELRGNAAWELTGDTCAGRTLRPPDPPCRLTVTVRPRATGDLAARLVLPWNRGTLTVPVQASVPLSYTVVVTVRGGGTVVGDRGGLDCPGLCTARVARGAVLTLTATGAPRWSGDCAGTAPTCRVTVVTPLQITADFG